MIWTQLAAGGWDFVDHVPAEHVTPGQVYSLGVEAMQDRPGVVRLQLVFRDSSGAVLAQHSEHTQVHDWTRLVIAGAQAPARTATISARLDRAFNVGTGETLAYRRLILTATDELPDYFDGASTDTPTHRTRWAGPAHRSVSLSEVTEDITGPLQSLTITRGGSPETGRIIDVAAGTATLTLLGDRSDLDPATPFRVVHTQLDDQPLFTGTVQDTQVVYSTRAGVRSARTHITATDAVQVLANTMRYGVAIDRQRFADRIDQLMASAPEVTVGEVQLFGGPLIGDQQNAVVYESTLANHLTMACTGRALAWVIDRFNHLVIRSTYNRTGWVDNSSLFSDGSRALSGTPETTDRALWKYLDVAMSRSTRDQVTEVSILNHGRKPDPDNPGSFLADDIRHGPFLDDEAVAAYGRRSVSLDTSIAGPQDGEGDPASRVAELGQWWVQRFRAARRPTWVRFDALAGLHLDAPRHTRPPDVLGPDRLAWRLGLDVGSPLWLDHERTTHRCFITRIRHTLTPTSWHTEYDLAHQSEATVRE